MEQGSALTGQYMRDVSHRVRHEDAGGEQHPKPIAKMGTIQQRYLERMPNLEECSGSAVKIAVDESDGSRRGHIESIEVVMRRGSRCETLRGISRSSRPNARMDSG